MTFSLFNTPSTNQYSSQNTLGFQNQSIQQVNRSVTKSPISDKIDKFNKELSIYSPTALYGQPHTIANVNDQDYLSFSKLTGREKVVDLPPTLKNYLHVVLRKINENKKHSIAIKTCLTETNESRICEPMTNILRISDSIAKLMKQIQEVEIEISSENDFLFKKIYEIGIIFNNFKDFTGNTQNMNGAVGQLGRLSFKECQTLINHILKDYVEYKDKVVCGIKKDYEKLNEIYLQISGMVRIERTNKPMTIEDRVEAINNFIEEYSNIYTLLNTRIDQLSDKNKTIKDKFVKIFERTKANYNSSFSQYEQKLKHIKSCFKESMEFDNIKDLLINSKL